MKRLILLLSLIILFCVEIFRVYLVMPFPGSQLYDTVAIAYWLNGNAVWIRLAMLILISFQIGSIFSTARTLEKCLWSVVLAGYMLIFFLFNYRYQADHIFIQPGNKSFTTGKNVEDKSKLVIGLVINGEAKAYPIQLIGYHHQVVDTVGNTPVMITYCTVCRTGRVFDPKINGETRTFRLVGMDRFNAVFEDKQTGTWWRQATGEAIAGPMKGSVLKEFQSTQLPLEAWLRQYPGSLVMLPDTTYNDRYFRLEDYDRGTMPGNLVRRDTLSWRSKSWIVGVLSGMDSKAFDWNELVKKRIIHDSLERQPILVAMEKDTNAFHVYDRTVNGTVLNFQLTTNDTLVDENTQSRWNIDGLCIAGVFKGERLERIQAYNEFWHSWQTFRGSKSWRP